MLRRVFGSKKDKVTGEWRRLHIEDGKRPLEKPARRWENNTEMDL
jgi:hypothetical protein